MNVYIIESLTLPEGKSAGELMREVADSIEKHMKAEKATSEPTRDIREVGQR